MKKFLILLILSLTLITTSCKTKPKNEIILPPKPQREEQPEVTSLKDVGKLISYYESLVSKWEVWGDDVIDMIEKNQTSALIIIPRSETQSTLAEE